MGKHHVLLFIAVLLLTFSSPSQSNAAEASCPSYNVFGRVMTDICWDCMYPMTIAGLDIGGGTKPSAAANAGLICKCTDRNGIPWFGFPYASWQPARLVEVVTRPYCAPTLGGITLQSSDGRMMGGRQPGNDEPLSTTFYNFHYYAFPINTMLNMFTGCATDGYLDFDMMYLSEVDPTWNNDELAFFTNPEITMTANPVAVAACIADAALTTFTEPSDALYWCAGSWGSMYPFTGNIDNDSLPEVAGLVTARALAAIHRRMLAWKFMGDAAMCKPYVYPSLPKTQYKFSQLYPYAESNGNHWIGESSILWGQWRTNIGNGESFVELIWRWSDCCVQTF